MKSTIMLLSGLMVFALLAGEAEQFKIRKYQAVPPPPPQEPQPAQDSSRLYPAPLWLAPQAPRLLPLAPQQPAYYQQLAPIRQEITTDSGIKGGQRLIEETKGDTKNAQQATSAAALSPDHLRQPSLMQSQAYAYFLVRPIQPQYQYLEPANYRYLTGQQSLLRPALSSYNYRHHETTTDSGTKGKKEKVEYQQIEQQKEIIEQQHQEPDNVSPPPPQPQPQPIPQPAVVIPIPPGKEGKLRAMLEKIKSKFTLGSTYQIIGEEYVQPLPPPQPQPQPPQVEQQQIEEQVPESQRDIGFSTQEQTKDQLPEQQNVQLEQQQQQELPKQQELSKGGVVFKTEESKSKRQPIAQQEQLNINQERHNESSNQLKNNSGF